MTGGGTATPEPLDLSEISRSGDLFDTLAARRITDSDSPASDDPAVRLLAALVADVDVDAPPLPAPARLSRGASKSGRPVVRAFVTFGAVTIMLAMAGAAVAGGGGDQGGHQRKPRIPSATTRLEPPERSRARLEPTSRRSPTEQRASSAGAAPADTADPSPRPSGAGASGGSQGAPGRRPGFGPVTGRPTPSPPNGGSSSSPVPSSPSVPISVEPTPAPSSPSVSPEPPRARPSAEAESEGFRRHAEQDRDPARTRDPAAKRPGAPNDRQAD